MKAYRREGNPALLLEDVPETLTAFRATGRFYGRDNEVALALGGAANYLIECLEPKVVEVSGDAFMIVTTALERRCYLSVDNLSTVTDVWETLHAYKMMDMVIISAPDIITAELLAIKA